MHESSHAAGAGTSAENESSWGSIIGRFKQEKERPRKETAAEPEGDEKLLSQMQEKTHEVFQSIPDVGSKASKFGHELADLSLAHPDATQHAIEDVAKSTQRTAGLLKHERPSVEAAAIHGFEAAKDTGRVVTAAPSNARAAFLKAVQSVSDLVGGVTAPSIFKGAKGISEGVQTSSNMGLAAAKSPGYSSSALWETLRAGLNIALIPVLEPGRAFKAAWQSMHATTDVAGLALRSPSKTASTFSALTSAAQQMSTSVQASTALARAAPGGAIGFYTVAVLMVPLVALAAAVGLLVGTATELCSRIVDYVLVFIASCISQAARVLAFHFIAPAPQALRYYKPTTHTLELIGAPVAPPVTAGPTPFTDTSPLQGVAVSSQRGDEQKVAYFKTSDMQTKDWKEVQKKGEEGRGMEESKDWLQPIPKFDAGESQKQHASVSEGLLGSTPLAVKGDQPVPGIAPDAPHTQGADTGVRPTWHPAHEALEAARQKEKEAQETQAKNEAATLFGAIRDMGSLLAFWRPVKETLNKGDTKSTNGTPSQETSRKSFFEKVLPARLFSNEPRPDFATQMRSSFRREEPCSNTKHGAVPTPQGPLLPIFAIGQSPYNLGVPSLISLPPPPMEVPQEQQESLPQAATTAAVPADKATAVAAQSPLPPHRPQTAAAAAAAAAAPTAQPPLTTKQADGEAAGSGAELRGAVAGTAEISSTEVSGTMVYGAQGQPLELKTSIVPGAGAVSFLKEGFRGAQHAPSRGPLGRSAMESVRRGAKAPAGATPAEQPASQPKAGLLQPSTTRPSPPTHHVHFPMLNTHQPSSKVMHAPPPTAEGPLDVLPEVQVAEHTPDAAATLMARDEVQVAEPQEMIPNGQKEAQQEGEVHRGLESDLGKQENGEGATQRNLSDAQQMRIIREGMGTAPNKQQEKAQLMAPSSGQAITRVVSVVWNEIILSLWLLMGPVWNLMHFVVQRIFWSGSALGMALLGVWDSLRALLCAPYPAYPGEPLWNRAHRLCMLLLQPYVLSAAALCGAVDTQLWRMLGLWASIKLVTQG